MQLVAPDIPAMHLFCCIFVAMLGASFSVVDKYTSVKDSCWHIALAGFLAGVAFPALRGFFPGWAWYVWLLPLGIKGFAVYGIAKAMKKSSNTASDIDVVEELRKRLGGK